MSFTILKKNPSQGEITSSLTGSTGDGAGLHLADGGYIELANNAAAEFGTSDFSLEFVLNQTGDNTSDNYIYLSQTAGNNRLYFFNDISANKIQLGLTNNSGSTTTVFLDYDMAQDYGTPTHYAMTFDRDGDLTLYKNGNSVATVDISGQSGIDFGSGNTNVGRISSSGAGYGVLGTFYRFRTWNKLLSSAEVQTAYERADVDFADQYGTANAPFTSINLSSGWSLINANATIDDSDSYTTTSGGTGIMYPLTVGKKYRLEWNVTGSAFDGPKLYTIGEVYIAIPDAPSSGTLSGALEFTATKTKLYLRNGSAGTVDINSMSLVQIGAVTDLDLAAANPTQSRTVQDRAGVADGTASTSGVTQVQPVVQLNATSARIGVTKEAPADGDLLVSGNVGVGCNPSRELEVTGGGNVYTRITAQTANDSTALELKNTGGTWTIVNDDTDSEALKFKNTGGTRLTIDSSGHVIVANMPTSSSGLASGTLYSDGGTIKIV